MSAKTPPKTAWQPGQSGNPKGRPQGSRNKATILATAQMQDALPDIVATLLTAAANGDVSAAKVVLDKCLPSVKERMLDVSMPSVTNAADLPRLTASILQAVATGGLTPGEAEKIAALAVAHGKVLEIAEFERRLTTLEDAQNE